jgi:hypothetical protein
VHPVAQPRGGGGAQHRPGMKGGRGSKYSNIDGHSGSRYGGGGMTIERVERRVRSYLTFNIRNRQV